MSTEKPKSKNRTAIDLILILNSFAQCWPLTYEEYLYNIETVLASFFPGFKLHRGKDNKENKYKVILIVATNPCRQIAIYYWKDGDCIAGFTLEEPEELRNPNKKIN